MRELAAIFAGGSTGALARAGLSEALTTDPGAWPFSTFTVNVLGAALLGYFVTRLQERLPPARYRRPFLATGVCGALTTFSTLQGELTPVPARGRDGFPPACGAASTPGAFAAVALATSLTRRV